MRRALCVGIDEYSFGALTGCVSDATRMEGILRRHHDDSPNFECLTLVAPGGSGHNVVTRPILREHIERLFHDPADVALLYFAGHGSVNALDGFLVTQDATRYDEGVALTEILTRANDSRAGEVVIMLD